MRVRQGGNAPPPVSKRKDEITADRAVSSNKFKYYYTHEFVMHSKFRSQCLAVRALPRIFRAVHNRALSSGRTAEGNVFTLNLIQRALADTLSIHELRVRFN